jgi:hypothetical protein
MRNAMLSALLWAFALLLAIGPVKADPVNWIQGKWQGTCVRGSHTLPAGLLLDSAGGSLNEKVVASLKILHNQISFVEGQKQFSGSFSPDYSQLTGQLNLSGKAASCSMTRHLTESDTICILNDTSENYFIRLKSNNGHNQSFWVFAGNKSSREQGDRTGTLCWATQEFPPNQCPRFLPQKTYSCQN